MSPLYLNGRKAIKVHVSFGSTKDICDAFIEEAMWMDSEEWLTQEELIALQEANEWQVQEAALEMGGYH